MFTRLLSCSLLPLLMILILSGCSTSPTAQSAMKKASPHPSATAIAQRVLTVPARTFNMLNGNAAERPLRLIIPAIGVNASVEPVEILPDGNLGTPTRSPWENVGWYDLGTSPGERGSAVIDGHLDHPGGTPAVFWNLRFLHPGDDVQVLNAEGKTLDFRVIEVAFYTPEQAPVADIFGDTGGNYLNLITCAGDWIPSEHQTTLRLVVYTALVS
jgi:sortase (surface protein transpeptidase)